MKPFLLISVVFGLGAFAGNDALSFQDLLDPYGLLSAVLFIGYNLDQKIGKLTLRIALIERGRRRSNRPPDEHGAHDAN